MELSTDKLEQLRAQCLEEFGFSRTGCADKKEVFRERSDLYADIEKSQEKLTVRTVRGIIRTMLALYYTDSLTVQFKGRNIYTWEAGMDWNNVMENDYKEMEMEVHDYINQMNRLSKGVGIRLVTGWDNKNTLVDFEVIDPVSRWPDPNGHTHPNFFAYMGFDRTLIWSDVLKYKDEFMDFSKIQAVINSEEQQNMLYDKLGRHIVESMPTGKRVTLYYHLTTFEGKQCMVCMFGDQIQSYKVIEPIMDQLKTGNKYKLKWPVALNYFDPIKGDPRGVCVPDLAGNEQRIQSLVLNLLKIKAVKQALGGTMFIDRDIYRGNKKILENPSKTLKIIPVKGHVDKGIQNSVYQVPEEQISPDVYNLPNIIKQNTNESTGISEQVRGIDDGKAKTAYEVNNAQQNSNMNLVLANKVNSRGEKQFYGLVYCYYKHYFDSSSKKYVEINNGYANTTLFYILFTRTVKIMLVVTVY